MEAQLDHNRERPRGPLRVTTTVGFGSVWLPSQINEFLDRYPEINLSLVIDDSEVDVHLLKADVAIRMAPPRHPNLIQRHLFTGHIAIYAAPSYLRRFGTPANARRSARPPDRHLRGAGVDSVSRRQLAG